MQHTTKRPFHDSSNAGYPQAQSSNQPNKRVKSSDGSWFFTGIAAYVRSLTAPRPPYGALSFPSCAQRTSSAYEREPAAPLARVSKRQQESQVGGGASGDAPLNPIFSVPPLPEPPRPAKTNDRLSPRVGPLNNPFGGRSTFSASPSAFRLPSPPAYSKRKLDSTPHAGPSHSTPPPSRLHSQLQTPTTYTPNQQTTGSSAAQQYLAAREQKWEAALARAAGKVPALAPYVKKRPMGTETVRCVVLRWDRGARGAAGS